MDFDGDIDPDYQQNYTAIRQAELNQVEAEGDCVERLRQIIREEFDKELLVRRKHIEGLEEQLFKAQKLLHLVRYSLVNQYYSNKSLELDGEELQEDANLISFDGQNRIHPAIKKLLDNNSTLPILNRGKRKTKNVVAVETNVSSADVVDEPETKRVRLEDKQEPLINSVLPLSSNVRNRRKIKQRLVIGNISKYVPSSENDVLVYRWMVYVRGPKEKPDVSGFIQKVVFHLHPSYKPNDVITISQSPYHLARRGWGEFPIRVQIVFKNSLNKPVDIVHQLKLDQKHTGRQILGNETIVDVYLHEEEEMGGQADLDKLIDEEVNERLETSVQQEDEDNLISNPNEDHNYSLHYSLEGIKVVKTDSYLEANPETPLIYGLEDYLLQDNNNKTRKPNNVTKKESPVMKMVNTGKNMYLVANAAKNLFLVKNKQISQQESLIDYNQFKVELPAKKFKSMGEALPYLFKRLPLWHKLANNLNFRCTYPFVALSYEDYSKFNIGKRLSCEWSRAKTIKKLLENQNIYNSHNWNTKALIMYGRSHCYTPLTSMTILERDCKEKTLILNCYATDSTNNNHLKDCLKEEDINVDILNETPQNQNNSEKIDITDKTLDLQCSYVRQIALNSGIILKPEEILPNVMWNGAERLLLEAMKNLAENLIRRANCHRVCNPQNTGSELTKEHVEIALQERQEFQAIANFKKQKRELEFFM